MPQETLRVLHVEDNPADARLLREDFREYRAQPVELLQVGGAWEAVETIQKELVDLILLDADLPDVVGIATVVTILQVAPNVPIVVLTGHEDRTFAEDAIRLGAQNCIVKGSMRGSGLVRQILVDVQRFKIARQINEQIREVAREKARYQSIITDNVDALVLIDDTGIVQFINPSGENLFGRRAKDMVGQPFGLPVDEGEHSVIDLVRADGTKAAADMRIMRTSWEKGPGYVATLRDITAEREEVRELRVAKIQAERANRLKSNFLAKMSHELRTPLNAILGYSQMMGDEMFGPIGVPKYRGYVQSIRQAGEHLLNVVNDLLDLAKIEAEKLTLNETVFNLCSVLENAAETAESIAVRKNVTIELDGDCEETFVKGDLTRLSQVIYNLLSNAIKFSPEGGVVTLRLCIQGRDNIAIQVVDRGVGISKIDQERIFNAFVQAGDAMVARDSEGTGLGLTVSYELVQLHGGRIHVDSASGKGTTMTVSLPRERLVNVEPHHRLH